MPALILIDSKDAGGAGGMLSKRQAPLAGLGLTRLNGRERLLAG